MNKVKYKGFSHKTAIAFEIAKVHFKIFSLYLCNILYLLPYEFNEHSSFSATSIYYKPVSMLF